MIIILSIILFILLITIGKSRGFKTFLTFYLSLFLIVLYLSFCSLGFSANILAIIICILATLIILFTINGYNVKTKSSFYSIMIILLILFIIISIIGNNANLQGFSYESSETIGGLSHDINYNMTNLLIGTLLISVIGTIIDTSMSISSAMYEVYSNNNHLNRKQLFLSGMNVGKDIMSTTINTLFFALLSSFIGFAMWHRSISIEYLLNYKEFAKLVIELLLTFISSISIIPITSYISSYFIVNKKDID